MRPLLLKNKAKKKTPLSLHLVLSQFGGSLLSIFAKSRQFNTTELNDMSRLIHRLIQTERDDYLADCLLTVSFAIRTL